MVIVILLYYTPIPGEDRTLCKTCVYNFTRNGDVGQILRENVADLQAPISSRLNLTGPNKGMGERSTAAVNAIQNIAILLFYY